MNKTTVVYLSEIDRISDLIREGEYKRADRELVKLYRRKGSRIEMNDEVNKK